MALLFCFLSVAALCLIGKVAIMRLDLECDSLSREEWERGF